MNDRLGEANALRHAFRISANAVLAPTCQADKLEDFGDALASFGAAHAREARVKIEQGVPGQPIVKSEIFRQVTDAPACLSVARRLTEDARLTAGRGDQAEQDLYRCRLTRAVRSEEPEHFTGLNGEI
jgi:hypothetical protein